MKPVKLTLIFILAGLFSFGAICGGKKKPTLVPPPPEPVEEVVIEKPVVEPVVEAPKEPLVFDNVYFDFNKHDLKPEARGILREMAEKLRDNPDASIRIEGHCDERGTEQYNLALGEKRALEAKKFLIGAGVAGDRVDLISYGEERPANPGHNEDAWGKNRRDEFKVLQ